MRPRNPPIKPQKNRRCSGTNRDAKPCACVIVYEGIKGKGCP
ncbi:MAG: hypothetical protein NZL83_04810 [Candidatus Absconditabacterales bacterium]|nr:hypothetical protein [Candidatus Absconditabacterales bacterium]